MYISYRWEFCSGRFFPMGVPFGGVSCGVGLSVGSSSLRAASPTVIESCPLWGLPAAMELPRGKVFDVYRATAVSRRGFLAAYRGRYYVLLPSPKRLLGSVTCADTMCYCRLRRNFLATYHVQILCATTVPEGGFFE